MNVFVGLLVSCFALGMCLEMENSKIKWFLVWMNIVAIIMDIAVILHENKII